MKERQEDNEVKSVHFRYILVTYDDTNDRQNVRHHPHDDDQRVRHDNDNASATDILVILTVQVLSSRVSILDNLLQDRC